MGCGDQANRLRIEPPGLALGGCCPFQDMARFPYNILLDPSLDRFAVVLNEKMAVAMTSPPSSSGSEALRMRVQFPGLIPRVPA
jgi:hypothetical protein